MNGITTLSASQTLNRMDHTTGQASRILRINDENSLAARPPAIDRIPRSADGF
jgi:hypothetical protein